MGAFLDGQLQTPEREQHAARQDRDRRHEARQQHSAQGRHEHAGQQIIPDVNPPAPSRCQAFVEPVEAAKKWRKPAVVIHAERDNLIPKADAEALAAASGAELWVVPHAHHAHASQFAFEGYVQRIVSLL